MPSHVHDLRSRRAGHVGRCHEPPTQTMGPNGLDLARPRTGVAKEPFHDFRDEPRLNSGLAEFAVGRERDEQRALLLLDYREPCFECRDRARPGFEPRHRDELAYPTLIRLTFADSDDEEPGSPEVEIFYVERGDLSPPPSGSERQQQDRTVADRDRRRGRPLERERRGEPFGRDGGASMIAAGVFAPGAFEQVADDPMLGRRREPRRAVKEPDRRRSRAKGLRRRPALAQVAQEGRDECRMRPERFESKALGVGGELSPAGRVAAPSILGGRPGDEFAGGGDSARDGWGGGGRNVNHAGGHSGQGERVPVVLIFPLINTTPPMIAAGNLSVLV